MKLARAALVLAPSLLAFCAVGAWAERVTVNVPLGAAANTSVQAPGDVATVGFLVTQGAGRNLKLSVKRSGKGSKLVADVTDQHAVILNRNRDASMMLPGECLLLVEMVPALFAAVAANEAERVAPGLTLVDCQMIGASGRVFMSGSMADAERARDHILATLAAVEGRAK